MCGLVHNFGLTLVAKTDKMIRSRSIHDLGPHPDWTNVQMNASEAELQLVNLSKEYTTGVRALDQINMTVRAGEFITLLGPSGSGKTTTLNLIAGFIKPTTGKILVNGHDVVGLPVYKRDIGMVFQSYALFPHMTVEQNVEYSLKRRSVGAKARREKVDSALEMLGLSDFAKRSPSQLSGGQQQRVALARSLVFEPRLLLLDEPMGALDRKLRESVQLELKRIHRNLGVSFVYVTHDQEEALVLSDRIAVFNNGRIEQLGTSQELYNSPRTEFVASFIGESTVFRGRVTNDGALTTVVTPVGRFRVDGIASSSIASFVVRPENFEMVTLKQAQKNGPVNEVAGVVSESIYVATAWKYEVRLRDDSLATVRVNHSSESPFAIGDEVMLRWESASGVLVQGAEDFGDIIDDLEMRAKPAKGVLSDV